MVEKKVIEKLTGDVFMDVRAALLSNNTDPWLEMDLALTSVACFALCDAEGIELDRGEFAAMAERAWNAAPLLVSPQSVSAAEETIRREKAGVPPTWEAERVALEIDSNHVGDPWPAGWTTEQIAQQRAKGFADLKRAGWTISVSPPSDNR